MSMLEKINHNVTRFKTKNRFILANDERPARKDCVNYEWWCDDRLADNNLGDYLAPLINNWMLGRKGLANTVADGPLFLASVGSVLGMSLNDCTVWGSGFLSEEISPAIRPLFKKLDIRAVRGPQTKALLESRGYTCPALYGDPAMLMPLMYKGTPFEGKKEPLVILHYQARNVPEDNCRHLSILTSDYKKFIDSILASSLVVSSSLHGIILAESYGVPAILLNDHRNRFSPFKYEDWYYSTNRCSFPVASSVNEALALDPAPLPQLGCLQEGLLAAFPYDLWEQRA